MKIVLFLYIILLFVNSKKKFTKISGSVKFLVYQPQSNKIEIRLKTNK